MGKFALSSKEKVRDWLKGRRLKNDPPPDIEQIQIDLGWSSAEPVVEADNTRSIEFHRLQYDKFFVSA